MRRLATILIAIVISGAMPLRAQTSNPTTGVVTGTLNLGLADGRYCKTAGCTLTGNLFLSFTTPVLKVADTSGTNAGFITNIGDGVAISVNKNTVSGTFTDAAKTHAAITLNGTAANSNINFKTTAANNTTATTALTIDKSQNVCWGTSADACIAWRAANGLQIGQADSATPAPQTISFQRANSGSNTAGVDSTIACGGSGTGNATGSKCVLQIGTPQASGTTAHAFNTAETFQDFGLSNTQRAVITTGSNVYQESIGNTKFVTADFTTASASFVTITGLSWTMPANHAMNVPFHCDLLYSQATAAAANQFGIQDVTVAPTSLMVKSTVWTSASVANNANVPALTTTTATSVNTFTPSAITTVWNATIDGFIEQPSNAAESVINILVLTGNVADSITVKRGSNCRMGF